MLKISFDVISIQPSKPGTPPSLRLENNRFTADFTLFGYIVSAYDLMPSREQMDSMLARVPKWVSTDSFEIQAVAEGNPTEDQMWLMVRSLLADRFQLEVHTVTAQVPVFALVLEKPGKTDPNSALTLRVSRAMSICLPKIRGKMPLACFRLSANS